LDFFLHTVFSGANSSQSFLVSNLLSTHLYLHANSLFDADAGILIITPSHLTLLICESSNKQFLALPFEQSPPTYVFLNTCFLIGLSSAGLFSGIISIYDIDGIFGYLFSVLSKYDNLISPLAILIFCLLNIISSLIVIGLSVSNIISFNLNAWI